MAITQKDILRQQRHAAMEATLKQNRGAIGFVAVGFVALLTLIFQGYEQTTVPRGIDARHAFERVFDADWDNETYDALGEMKVIHGFKTLGDVTCGIHTDRRNDQAYDYDCVAILTEANGCTRFFPFYVERSSIGPISRPVSEELGRDILARFKLLGSAPTC